jgi:hypothetical protein
MNWPERADYSLTESALSPFPAEPAHCPAVQWFSTADAFTPKFLLSWRLTTSRRSQHDRRGTELNRRGADRRTATARSENDQNVLTGPVGQAYGDYVVTSASGKEYRVAMRGPSLFENFCSCADFAVNTLGTCKHIEALLLCLHRRFGRSFDRQQYRRTRASLSLYYGG